ALPGTLNVSTPTRPQLAAAGQPQVSLRLALSSQDPLLSTIAPALTAVLDPLIRTALATVLPFVPQLAAPLLAQLPRTPWGLGAAPAAGVPGAPPLGPLADQISDEIQRNHMPFDSVYPALFDQVGY